MAVSQAQKVLVISHEYPPIGGGGGKVIQDLCEGIASETHSFYILTAHFGDLPTLTSKGSLTIERLHSCRKEAYRASLGTMACFVWKSFWRAVQLIRQWKPDLIHAHFAVPAGASAALAGLVTGTPYMITVHGSDVPGSAPEKTGRWFKFIKPFSGFIWKHASRIITVSSRSQALAQSHYPVRVDVIPNGVDTGKYENKKHIVNKPPHILFVGRFSPEKNAIAVPAILSEIKNLAWHCTMIGDGLQMEEVKAALAKRNLSKRVTLTGWFAQEEVDRILLSCDILLIPSLREGMPMIGLQAMAAGNALILSDVGACPDMIDEGINGYSVKTRDSSAYAKALRSILTSQEQLSAMKINSKRKSASFDLSHVLNQYKQVYQEIIEVNKP